jgi:hypothetical protein
MPLVGEAPVLLLDLLEQFTQLLFVVAVPEEGVEQLRELATPVVVQLLLDRVPTNVGELLAVVRAVCNCVPLPHPARHQRGHRSSFVGDAFVVLVLVHERTVGDERDRLLILEVMVLVIKVGFCESWHPIVRNLVTWKSFKLVYLKQPVVGLTHAAEVFLPIKCILLRCKFWQSTQ